MTALVASQLSLSPPELCYLGGLLGSETFVGCWDPFEGWLKEEIAAELESARDSLIARELLIEHSDEHLTVPREVAILAGALALPTSVLTAEVTRTSSVCALRSYYRRETFTVRLDQSADSPVQLTQQNGSVEDDLWSHLGVLYRQPAPGRIFRTSREGLYECRARLASSSVAAVEALLTAGVEGPDAATFVESLGRLRQSVSLTWTHPRIGEAWRVEALAFLETRQGLLRLDSLQREEVEVRPVTGADLQGAVGRLARLPEE